MTWKNPYHRDWMRMLIEDESLFRVLCFCCQQWFAHLHGRELVEVKYMLGHSLHCVILYWV